MSALTAEQLQHWDDNGFLVLKGLIEPARTNAVLSYLDRAWNERHTNGQNISIDVRLNGAQRRIYFDGATPEDRFHPYKLNDLYLVSQEVRDISLDVTLTDIIADLIDGRPIACNSLIFEKGSGQPDHCDTFYMPPTVPNKMLATWVALETPLAGTGQLRYYPGSHKIPPYMWSHGGIAAVDAEYDQFDRYIRPELERRGIRETIFQPEKGDVFIWHAQLLHGGSPIKDFANTRKSLVTHYFRQMDYADAAVDVGGARYYMTKTGHRAQETPTLAESVERLSEPFADSLPIELENLRARIAAMDPRTTREFSELQQQLAAAQAKIAALESSRSWRITAPLRKVVSTLHAAATALKG